jgi:hypothetical protein
MAILVSSAQAAMEIHVVAEVESGLAFIKGKGAARGAPITWEGGFVTTANHGNGSFSFFGELPGDCTGVLSDGNETISITVFDCTAVAVTAALAPAPAAKTGQTVSIAPGDDGANCLQGIIGWFTAVSDARNLASGACGLSDGSRAGDWRLPNRNELASLLDLNKRNPALPSRHPFTSFQADKYWTSTNFGPTNLGTVWLVDFSDGSVTLGTTANFRFVHFVRDGS